MYEFQRIREKQGLTQKELAKRMKVTPTSVSNWERGKNCPLRWHRRRMAEVLQCSMDVLFKPVQEVQGVNSAAKKSE